VDGRGAAAATPDAAHSGSVGWTAHCGCRYSCTGLSAAATFTGRALRRKGSSVVVVVVVTGETERGDTGCRYEGRCDRGVDETSKYITASQRERVSEREKQ
jgi:hypothetical protein